MWRSGHWWTDVWLIARRVIVLGQGVVGAKSQLAVRREDALGEASDGERRLVNDVVLSAVAVLDRRSRTVKLDGRSRRRVAREYPEPSRSGRSSMTGHGEATTTTGR